MNLGHQKGEREGFSKKEKRKMRNFLFLIIPSPHPFDVPSEWCVYYNIGMSKFAMKILGKNSKGIVDHNVPLWCLRLKIIFKIH